jgi:hypothetical protein
MTSDEDARQALVQKVRAEILTRYVVGGRAYQALPSDQLLKGWIATFRRMASDPLDVDKVEDHEFLVSD